MKFAKEIIADVLSKVPSQFTLYPITPEYREIKFGSGEIYFGTNALDWTWDLETGDLAAMSLLLFRTGQLPIISK